MSHHGTLRAWVAALLAAWALACGGGRAAPAQTLVPLFEGSRIDDARALAPELAAQADAARDGALRAEQAGERERAEELATEARLWLAATLASADQVTFEREHDADVAASEQAQQQTLALDQERERVVEREATARVGALASEAAARAFEHAVGYESRRSRRDDPDTRALYRETSLALQQRCAVLIAAARALGAPPHTADELEQRLAALQRARRPELVVTEADQLLGDAMGLLGSARAALPADPSEPSAVIEAARERGLTATRSERGLELRGPSIERTQPAGLRQVAALLAAHPRGGVQILVIGPAAQQRAARRRANALQSGLTQAGVASARLSVVELTVNVETAGLALALPAY